MFGGFSRQAKESLSLYNLPGVAALFYKASRLDLPQAFRRRVTEALIHRTSEPSAELSRVGISVTKSPSRLR
jgi:hypothetical protein